EFGFDLSWSEIVAAMVRNVLQAPLDSTGLCLADVKSRQRLNELEFYYPLADLDAAGSRPIGVPGQQPLRDPLADYADLHPIIPLLVEWRRQNLQSPRFASEEVFDRILAGEQKLPITEVTFTLQPRSRRKAGTA
ncbi:MAG: hypothetical protein KDE56_24230, partial [Anaerolineales bacterium]|nr:hypothetical protein [Anaerolineales bacterium]